jgi:serine/threonine protein phosphatase PrpC
MSNLKRNNTHDYSYIAGGVSHIGSSHTKKNMVNQDSFGVFQEETYTMVALADGHGSAMHFRSDIGSKFAIEAAHTILKSFVENKPLTQISRALELIKKRILNKWQELCKEDMHVNPIKILKRSLETHIVGDAHVLETTGENIVMHHNKEIHLSNSEAKRLLSHPLSAYGSTLLAALIIEEGILLLQLGDGDMRLYYQKEPMNFIIPSPLMYGNATHSLASSDAIDHMQIVFTDTIPDFIFLSTDGIINSLEDEKDYQTIGFQMMKSFNENEASFHDEVSKLIERFAIHGSGDDCSLTYIFKKNKIKKEL